MAEQCDVFEDSGWLAETWHHVRAGVLADAGTLRESWHPSRATTLVETGTLHEVWDGTRAAHIRDTAALGESWQLTGNPVGHLSDTAQGRDHWTAARSATLADAGTLDEAYTLSGRATLRETGTLAESWHPKASPRALLSEQGRLLETLRGTRTATLADAGTLGEGWHMRRGAVLAETGTFTDAFTGTGTPRAQLLERGTFTETWATRAHPRGLLVDEGLVEETWLSEAGATTDAWTANTDTFAMSRYEGLGLDSLAVIAGVLHGSGPEGIYRIDADTDRGQPIHASVTTGLDDFGSEAVKRMRACYAGARTDGPGSLAVDVRDVGYGRVAWHSFTFEPRAGDDAAPQRAKLARGMRSRYWQIRITNVEGAEFTLNTLSLLADSLSRRV